MSPCVVNGSPKKAEMMAARREYLRHLSSLRKRVRETAGAQRVGLYYRHPEPGQLWSTAGSHRVWERRPADPDFGVVRLAVGPQTLATPLTPPVTRPLDELEPMTAGALRRFLDAYSVVPDLPVAASLRGFARVFLRGPDRETRALTLPHEIQDADGAAYTCPQLPWATMWKTMRAKLPMRDGILVNTDLPSN